MVDADDRIIMGEMSDITLTILTLNIWGIPMISKDRSHRVEALITVLESGNYDLICLQEVWAQEDFERIKYGIKNVLPYSHYFYSGVNGSGLCIFSRWPMEDIIFHQWPVNGYIHKIFHGDWFGGKGVGLCHITTNGVHINLYTTHLHAQYDLNDDEYLAHRVVQAFDTAQFIRLTSEGAHLSILAGDLNTQPGDLCYQLVKNTAQLSDTYEARDTDVIYGTNECARNSYADKKNVLLNPNGARIDHILYRSGLGAQTKVLSYSMPLETRVPGFDFSYSDHEAISATLKISLGSFPVSNPSCFIKDSGETASSLKAGISVCNEALAKLSKVKLCYYGISATLFTLLLSIPTLTEIPVTYNRTYQLSLVGVSGVIFFTLIMATIWNKMEYHGILGSQLRMETVLNRIMSSSFILDSNSDTVSARLLMIPLAMVYLSGYGSSGYHAYLHVNCPRK